MKDKLRNLIETALLNTDSYMGSYPPGKCKLKKVDVVEFNILESVDVINFYLEFSVEVAYNAEEINTYEERMLLHTVKPEGFEEWHNWIMELDEDKFTDPKMFDGIVSTTNAMIRI